jgi:hypothetical protein
MNTDPKQAGRDQPGSEAPVEQPASERAATTGATGATGSVPRGTAPLPAGAQSKNVAGTVAPPEKRWTAFRIRERENVPPEK